LYCIISRHITSHHTISNWIVCHTLFFLFSPPLFSPSYPRHLILYRYSPPLPPPLLPPSPLLPLSTLIYQAKIQKEQFSETRERLEAIGYIVADLGQDGFALLTGDAIYAPGNKGVNGHLKGVTVQQLRDMALGPWFIP
jgi:hypothetical protein